MPSAYANPDRDNLYAQSRSHHVSNDRWIGTGETQAKRARPATFRPDAVDADRDLLVQEGTPFERAARPKGSIPRPIVPEGSSDPSKVGQEFDPDTYKGSVQRGQMAVGIPIEHPFPKLTYGMVDHVHAMVKKYLADHPEYDEGELKDSYDDVMAIPENQRALTAAYLAAPDLDTSDEVTKAYAQFRKEVEEQYKYLLSLGITHEVVDYDPYPDIEAMLYDVRVNHRIKSLATKVTGSHEDISDEANDHLRAVHDVFGHAASGRGFDRHGEESAFQAHAAMFGPLASRVAVTEFRAQASTLIVTGQRSAQKHALLPIELGDINLDVRKNKSFGEHESGLWLPWGVLDDMEPDLAAHVKGVETAHPVATERLRQYWTHGPGAAKIRWGEPGDFKRCVRQVEKYMPGRAEGYCANRHHEALGVWPGREHGGKPGGHKDDDWSGADWLDNGTDVDGVPYDEHHPDVIAVFDVEQAAYDAWGKSLSPEEIVETKALNIPGIFDVAGWIRALAKDARDILTRVYVDAATKELARLRDQVVKIEDAGLSPPIGPADLEFDVNMPDVASAITSQVNRIANVDEATYARIADTLADGEAKGETMPQLSDRVRAVFETSKMRAVRIARTEVTAGANSAQMLAAQRNGATTKTWLSVHDPRTREAHVAMDHRTVAIDGHFAVPVVEGGVPVAVIPMEYPGDPSAPPSLTVNCRCTMIYGYGVDYPGAPESPEWFGRTA